jgi:DNA-binding transcriptional LysR family regulator
LRAILEAQSPRIADIAEKMPGKAVQRFIAKADIQTALLRLFQEEADFAIRAFVGVKAFLGQRPLVLDREFSYQVLLEAFVAEEIHFVIRLNLGSQLPTRIDEAGKKPSS